MTIKFEIFQDEDGWFIAKWDSDLSTGGITTQAHSLPALFSEIREAVQCHFDADQLPDEVKLHFVEDPKLELREAA